MKKSNKGFSLVELIIVIAIMAVLIAVLAPQYIQYVEKTKKQSDSTAISEVFKAAETAVADPANKVTGKEEVKVSNGGVISSTTPAVTSAIQEVVGSKIELKSNFFTGGTGSTLTFDVKSGHWSKTYSGDFATMNGLK